MNRNEYERKLRREAPKVFSIRQCYIDQMILWNMDVSGGDPSYIPPRSYDGLDNGFGKRKSSKRPVDSEWYLIYDFAKSKKVPAELLIRCVFEARKAANRRHPPGPKEIRSSVAIDLYKSQAKYFDAEVQRAYATQMRRCAEKVRYYQAVLGMSRDEATLEFLTNPLSECSALFRYSVLRQLGEEKIAHKYESEAIDQYLPCSGFYDLHWQDILPGDIRDVAK